MTLLRRNYFSTQNHSLKVDNEPNQYVALLHINKLKVKDSDTVNNLSIANAKGTTMYQFRIQKIKSKYVLKC